MDLGSDLGLDQQVSDRRRLFSCSAQFSLAGADNKKFQSISHWYPIIVVHI